ncbi:trigger factor [Pseudothermotoga thermarum]|uniref:Trigger factor n=1 Tax=Pseudothermotoga thermarum DSM 5069 TaxID=688269 RepID=F7YUP0_9THEM|nr:trigger factor [Pseudothermotoga thermarum]AEH50225.1 trigger factor [Pseudothermotoga thermarum DSM 5069]
MEKTAKLQDKNLVVFDYVFQKDEVDKIRQIAIKNVAARVEIPGFRKSKAPQRLIEIRYPETIKVEMVEALWQEVLKDLSNERVVLPPILADFDLSSDTAKLSVEVHRVPEVILKPFEEIELKKPEKDYIVSSYVEQRLKELQQLHAIVEPKEGPAEYDDLVRVKLTITKDGKVLVDQKETEYILYKDDDRPIVTEVAGKKAGEVVEFDKDFGSGNVYHYKIEIVQVNKRTLPEISDELAKMVSAEYETLEQLKKSIEKEGSDLYERDVKEFLINQAIDTLVDTAQLEISDRTLDELVQAAYEKIKKDRAEYERLIKEYGNDEKLKEALRKFYISDLKQTYAIEKAAEQNNITVSEDEILTQAENLALSWGISVERAKSLLKNREDLKEDVRWHILRSKVGELILSKAKIMEVHPQEAEKEAKEDEQNRA